MAISISLTRFFYKKSLSLDSKPFIDAIIESLTYILFTAHKSALYELLRKLYKSDESNLTLKIASVSDIKLSDLKLVF